MLRNLYGPAVVALLATPVAAQERGPFREVVPAPLPLDRAGVWTLHFDYVPPRVVPLDVPGKGKKPVLYLLYRVWNRSDAPVDFVPEFEIVTKDGKLLNSLDSPHPSVLKQIRAVEDPTGALNLHSSIGISESRIPVTKDESIPRAVYGVAVWTDVPDVAAETNSFSVYVTGLSNGLSYAESDLNGERASRKTLQIDLVRPTDPNRAKMGSIVPNENNGLGAEKWVYRVIPQRNKPAAAPAEPPKKDDK